MKQIILRAAPLIDFLLALPVLVCAVLLRVVRRIGIENLRLNRVVFNRVGIFPIMDHYYEPLFNPKHLSQALEEKRSLPGVDFNQDGQMSLLRQFKYNDELLAMPMDKEGENEFYFNNGWFGPGDAEYYYNLIRHLKPCKIIEIGSGYSTLMAQKAIEKNKREQANYYCQHVCIEPFENPWLEELEVEVFREKVEDVDIVLFESLAENDVLAIDSSHMIRPQGDVLFEFLRILPVLQVGAYVHIHDIFTPRDYPRRWLIDQGKFWNEQYLLEAFLTLNNSYEIVGALNYLSKRYPEEFSEICPVFVANGYKPEPGSFWMRRMR